MPIFIDFAGEQPIYQQIRDQIISEIAAGRLHAGDPLPSVRQLAIDIGVNMHTVNKAYTLLKTDGYLTINRRSGALVSTHFTLDAAAVTRIHESLTAAAMEACTRGMTKAEFTMLCESAFDALKEADS